MVNRDRKNVDRKEAIISFQEKKEKGKIDVEEESRKMSRKLLQRQQSDHASNYFSTFVVFLFILRTGGTNVNVFILSSAFTTTTTTIATTTSKIKTKTIQENSNSSRIRLLEKNNKKNNGYRRTVQVGNSVKQQYDQQKRKQKGRTKDIDSREQQTNDIPSIESLRNEIETWSQSKSVQGPTKAGHALRKMFRYYNPKLEDSGIGIGINIIDIENKESYHRSRVDMNDCNQVIQAWANCQSPTAPQQALMMLKVIGAMYKHNHHHHNSDHQNDSSLNNNSSSSTSTSNSSIRPNISSYNTVMNAFAQRGDFEQTNHVFKMLLKDYQQFNNRHAEPNSSTFKTMIHACSKCMDHHNNNRKMKRVNANNNNGSTRMMKMKTIMMLPHTAEKLLDTMNELYLKGDLQGDSDNGPERSTYLDVLNCWRQLSNRKGTTEAPQRALALLQRMMMDSTGSNSNTNNHTNIRPTTFVYNTVIQIQAQHGCMEGANTVFELMKRDYSQQNNTKAKPNSRTYTMLLNAISKSISLTSSTSSSSTSSSMIKQAELLFQEMIDLYQDGELREGPNIYAKVGDIVGATEIWNFMKQDDSHQCGRKGSTCTPNVQTYNTFINAWSRSKLPQAPHEAEALLKEMKELSSLTTTTTTTRDDCDEEEEEEVDDASTVVLREEDGSSGGPDTFTYNAVLNCWRSKSATSSSSRPDDDDDDDGPQRAYDILKTMIIQYQHHQQQDCCDGDGSTTTQNNRRVRVRILPPPRPDTITYSIVMDIYASRGNIPATKAIFQLMKDDYFNHNNKNAKPNIIVYNTLLKAYSKASSSLVLSSSLSCSATTKVSSTTTSTNNNSNNNDDIEQGIHVVEQQPIVVGEVEDILQEIKVLHRKGFLTKGPTNSTYRSMIVCFQKYQGTENRVRELIRLLPPR